MSPLNPIPLPLTSLQVPVLPPPEKYAHTHTERCCNSLTLLIILSRILWYLGSVLLVDELFAPVQSVMDVKEGALTLAQRNQESISTVLQP